MTTSARCLLVCTFNFSAWWHAYVDGRKTRTVLVDCAFIGVPLAGGTHHVELRYEPPYAAFFPG